MTSTLRSNDRLGPLTPRETQVAMLVSQGLTTKQIAVSLGVQPCTVKEFIRQALSKTSSKRRTQLADWTAKAVASRDASSEPAQIASPDSEIELLRELWLLMPISSRLTLLSLAREFAKAR